MGIFGTVAGHATSRITQALSGQSRSGFETNVISKLDNIESKLGGTCDMPSPEIPIAPVQGNLAQPSPVGDTSAIPTSPDIQYAGGGGRPPAGGFNPIAEQTANQMYGDEFERSMALQSRSLI